MRRTSNNGKKYNDICRWIAEHRADFRCEAMIDGRRCGKQFIPELITPTQFAHISTRAGKPDSWILDPDNIIFTCPEHHIAQHAQGTPLIRCDYEEVNYVPDPN